MKKVLIFFSLLSIMFMVGCTKDVENPQRKKWDKSIMEEISNYSLNYPAFFESAYDLYPMEVYCACDCNSVSALISAVNTNITMFGLPDSISFTCNELLPIGFSCNENWTSKRTALFNEIDSIANLEYINEDEADFIKDLYDDIYANPLTVNFQSHLSAFNQLDLTGSITDGVFTYGLLVSTKNVYGYFTQTTVLPDTNPTGFIIHKALGSLGGGWWSGMKYIWENRHCLECAGQGFGREVAWGAAGGAIMAL